MQTADLKCRSEFACKAGSGDFADRLVTRDLRPESDESDESANGIHRAASLPLELSKQSFDICHDRIPCHRVTVAHSRRHPAIDSTVHAAHRRLPSVAGSQGLASTVTMLGEPADATLPEPDSRS